MCTLKTCIRFRIGAKILQVLNAVTAVAAGFCMYGTIGRLDYNSLYHIKMTAAEENALWLQAGIFLLILSLCTFFSIQFGHFAEWLDDVIYERRCLERRHRTERIIVSHRKTMNIAVD